jgi:hypothetical protein
LSIERIGVSNFLPSSGEKTSCYILMPCSLIFV